jgi:hypothetical protein
MLALNLLGVDFAHSMGRGGEVAVVHSGPLRVKVHEAKRLEQLWQLDKDLIRPTPEHLGQDHPGQMINRMPPPALMGFAADKTPPLIDLRGLDTAPLYRNRFGTAPVHNTLVDLGERGGLFFNSRITVFGLTCSTRAISRTPLPLSVISTICRFTAGKRPGYVVA